MIDFGPFVHPGDGVWWGQAAAEPRPLVDARRLTAIAAPEFREQLENAQ
jgi:hypothetical protein